MHTNHITRTSRPGRLGGLALALLLGLAPAAARAKDICVEELPGITYSFTKVPALKPGRIVKLTGARVTAGFSALPIEGTAVVGADGRVTIGIAVHGLEPLGGVGSRSFLVVVEGDGDFVGSGSFDNDGDFRANSPLSWTHVDCATIEVP